MPSKPTNKELSEQLAVLEQRLNELGDLHPSIEKLQQIISDADSNNSKATIALQNATESTGKASELLTSAITTKTKLEELEGKAAKIAESAENSEKLLLERLNIANASELSASFSAQAGKLGTSSANWWKATQRWVVALVIAIGVVIGWEASITNDFKNSLNSLGFLIKLVVASPIAFLAYSASRQHRIETNLKHQYNFKASIASALGAYNKLLAENIAADDFTKKAELNIFLEERISAIFREPTENLLLLDDEGHESIFLGSTGRIWKILRKVASTVQASEIDNK